MNTESDIGINELLVSLRKEGSSAMLPVYRRYRENYLAFTSHYTNDRDLRLQSYHDAIIQLNRVLVRNKFDSEKSKLKTFLFNIGKNKLINLLEKENTYNKHILTPDQIDKDKEIPEEYIEDSRIKLKWKDELRSVFDSLGIKCQELIQYFYYDALDTSEIMKIMNYDSQNVVYSAKSRCLKKLKQLINKNRE